jgi:hypothetical protein
MSDDDISDTLKAKADQLNGDDLIGGPIVVTITKANKVSDDQPVILGITGGYQPFKPCLTMRRALTIAWGPKMSEWIGRSMKLYRDPSVKWAGDAIGGIRISHLSHIPKRLELFLTETRGKKKKTIIEVLSVEVTAADIKALKDRWMVAMKAAGQAASKELFETFIHDATAGAIAKTDVLIPAKYTQEHLQACGEAISRVGTPPDATDLNRQHEPAQALLRTIDNIKDQDDLSQVLEAIHDAHQDGDLDVETAADLARRAQAKLESK